MNSTLIDEAYQAMKDNPVLFGNVAAALKVSPYTMPDMIRKKSNRFAELPALKLIAEELKKTVNELLLSGKVESISE